MKTELCGNIAAVNTVGLWGDVNHAILQNNAKYVLICNSLFQIHFTDILLQWFSSEHKTKYPFLSVCFIRVCNSSKI